MLFDHWDNLIRILITGTLAYIGMIILLRASGNRTLSKMNSFDLVVTIAFGSTLSSVLINRDVSLAEGLVAIALLIGLQFLLTWLSVRSSLVNRVIKTTPTLLLHNGQFQDETMRRVRVTPDEIHSAIRKQGYGGMEQIAAVVLETDGKLSIISSSQKGSLSALHGVAGADRERD